MPAIKTLFQESWEGLKASFGNIFLLSLLGSTLGILLSVIAMFGIAGVGFLSALSSGNDKAQIVKNLESYLTPSVILHLGIAFAVVLLISIVISTVVRLAILIAIGKSKEKPSLTSCLHAGFAAFIPALIVGGVVSLIIFGASFLLIIPAVIICLFLEFVTYEIVLGGKKWFSALSGSVQIMSQHFGEVFLRMLLYWGIVYGVTAICVKLELSIVQFIFGIFAQFYGMVYGVKLYQHAKLATNQAVKPRMSWIWIVSILGWIIAIIIGFSLVKIAHMPFVQDKIKMVTEQIQSKTTMQATQQEKVDVWQAKMSPDAKALYDQSQDLFKQMHEQSADRKAVTVLNDKNIDLLKKATQLDADNPEIWANLADAYTWVSTKGKIEDALAASQKTEELDPTMWSYAYRTGSLFLTMERYDEAILKLQEVTRAEDNYGRGHISLGIAYKRAGIKESAKTELQKGIDILTKYNDKGDYDADILSANKELVTIK